MNNVPFMDQGQINPEVPMDAPHAQFRPPAGLDRTRGHRPRRLQAIGATQVIRRRNPLLTAYPAGVYLAHTPVGYRSK